jgi:geranylgeranyl diphosphate synthase, type II
MCPLTTKDRRFKPSFPCKSLVEVVPSQEDGNIRQDIRATCLIFALHCKVFQGLGWTFGSGMSTIAERVWWPGCDQNMTSSVAALIEGTELSEYLAGVRCKVEEALRGYLLRVDGATSSCPARLAAAMRYSALSGGKRLRPVLCVMATEACGGPAESALPAACAVEFVHAYSLIHDDLPAMDDDDLRRGRPTCHRAFDEATAILAGDGLLTFAFEVVVREVQPPSVALECISILAEAAGPNGMVAGQMADLQAEGRTDAEGENWSDGRGPGTTANLAALESIHRRKTGALLRAPLRMGAVIARAPETWIEALDRYGKAVGLAFQIVDDLLDVQGDETKLGKRVGKDSELGKWTYPRFLGVDGSRRRARQLVDEAVAALDPLGERACRLRDLAPALLERDR